MTFAISLAFVFCSAFEMRMVELFYDVESAVTTWNGLQSLYFCIVYVIY